MAEFASKGVAGAGLGLGIAGTALGVLSGGLGNILGNMGCNNMYNNCSENTVVTRYENGLVQEIAKKDTENALLRANIFTDQKIADVFERLNTRLVAMDKENCERFAQQATYNATFNGAISCVQGQVNDLMSLTKRVVPNTSICPGWGDVQTCVQPCQNSTTTPATATGSTK